MSCDGFVPLDWEELPDAEMQKLVRRARGDHALFHVRSRHGVEVVLRGTGDAARLVVPASYR